MNSEIVSSNLSITNDATLEKGMYSAKCDGEGTVSKKNQPCRKWCFKIIYV